MFLFQRAYAKSTRFNINWLARASSPQNKLHPVRCKSYEIEKSKQMDYAVDDIITLQK